VKGFNILYNYIHSINPNAKFGLTWGCCGGDVSGTKNQHLDYLKAGLHEDFASYEFYNACCADDTVFKAIYAAYPNVLTMVLFYATESVCESNGGSNFWVAPNKNVNIFAFWDVDNYGGWIGPEMDASFMQNADTFAATGSVASFCKAPVAWTTAWTWATQTKTFAVPIKDQFWSGWGGSYQIDSTRCQYQVMSGAKAVNGPTDPSVKVTLPWTNRTCNANITVTVGLSGNCNVNGNNTCLVFTRNFTTTGLAGDVTYQEYSIDY
jgi:hypothetical protein